MKRFATLTASLTLTLILAVSGFAAANANVIGGEKQTIKGKSNKSNRRAVRKTGNRRQPAVFRLPRLTPRQRREIFRKLIDIKIS